MTVRLRFLGAAHAVTGSRTLVSVHNRNWLVDCGLFQGEKSERDRNWIPFEPDPSTLAGVILTHAHLDHTGYLPRLFQEGFRGRVLCTDGTSDLTALLLRDAAHLEEESASFANRTGYSHHKPALPLFTGDDAEDAIAKLTPLPRDQWHELDGGLRLRFLRAGHIIGASLVQLAIETPAGSRTVTFSGDLGNGRSLILRGPAHLTASDVLILESTYGQRLQPRSDPLIALGDVIRRTYARGGVVVIPAFAVGRAQEVTYLLRLLEDQGAIPAAPVILDSPMATTAMDIYLRHTDDHVLGSAFAGASAFEAFRPKFFEVTTSADESMLACMREGPLVVISASGMLTGGRILHHLKARLKDSKNTIVFTGYQAAGSKGRFLQDHAGSARTLRIHHEEVPIEAEVVTLDCLSSHTDYQDTLEWLGHMSALPKQIFLNHGEPAAQEELAARIKGRFGLNAVAVAQSSRDVILFP